ncbi:MAG: DsbA family protein [Janthinobacterium lividum]
MAKRPDPGAEGRRRQARASQQAALARAKRRRTLIQLAIVGGVAVVVIAIVATAVVLGTRGRTTASAAGGPAATGTTTVDGASVPFAIGGSGDTANGVRVGADTAKVKMDLWVDYSCPHCQEFEATNNDTLTSLVASGKLAVTYHDIQIVTDYGTEAGSASACLAVHDPNAWPAFNAALYVNHTADTDSWTTSDFERFAAPNGGGDATQKCIAAGTYKDWITANTAASTKADVTGTPTMVIDGKKTDTLSGQDLTDRVNALASA